MSILSRLFGGRDAPAAKEVEPEIHDGFRIHADPVQAGGRWRLAGRIEKEVDGAPRSHQLIRADTLDSREEAVSATLAKARQVIDEQGDRLFD